MKLSKRIQHFFGPSRQIIYASAPGRIDVMGGIGDYSGSWVLQMPIRQRTSVYVALRDDGVLRAHSASAKSAGHAETSECRLKQIQSNNKKSFYERAQRELSKIPDRSWAAYIFGCALALIHDANAPIQGADFWIETNVPIGKGISSSAALEVAVMSALCRTIKLQLPGNQLPLLAQRVENEIVGAPCGLMDQLACYFGRENKLLPILCQPDILAEPISLPPNLRIIGIDSGVRHAVSGNAYGDARAATFMGYSTIAKQLGVSTSQLKNAKRQSLPFNGYLANITPSLFEREFASSIPDKVTGKTFLQSTGATIDKYTTPQPSRTYPVKPCTQYPIYENQRVKIFQMILRHLNSNLLKKKERDDCALQLGELMMQSHQGYNHCQLGSAATDALVERGVQFGPENGIFGAKITGGGSGGVVCFLCEGRKGVQSVREIAAQHEADFKCESTMFSGSSDGAHWTKTHIINT